MGATGSQMMHRRSALTVCEQDLTRKGGEGKGRIMLIPGAALPDWGPAQQLNRARRDISEPIWASGGLLAYIQHGATQSCHWVPPTCHVQVLGTQQYISNKPVFKVIH